MSDIAALIGQASAGKAPAVVLIEGVVAVKDGARKTPGVGQGPFRVVGAVDVPPDERGPADAVEGGAEHAGERGALERADDQF